MAVKNKTTAGGRGRRARTAKSPASDEQPKKFDEKPAASGRLKDEIWAIVVVAVGVFFAVALQTPAAGQLGAVIKTVMTGIFGATAYLLPYCMIFYGILVFAKKTVRAGGRSAVFLLLIFLMITVINAAGFIDPASISFSFDTISGLFGDGVKGNSGGFLGALTAMAFVSLLGKVGLYIFCTVLICISLLLVINTPLSQFFDAWKTRREEKRLLAEADGVFEPEGNGGMGGVYGNPGLAAGGAKPASEPGKKRRKSGGSEKKGKYSETGDAYGGYDIFEANARKRTIAERRTRILDYMNDDSLFEKNAEGFQEDPEAPDLFDVFKEPEEIAVSAPAYEDAPESSSGAEAGHGAKTSAKEPPAAGARKNFRYAFPPLSLLNKGPSSDALGKNENLRAKAVKLEQTLRDFNVDAKVVQVIMGPAVTRYEIQPGVGVKVNSIVRLADDIALNLEAKSIRIEAPIPGKAAVGIELENERINLVALREIISAAEFKTADSKISFAVGKDIAGKNIVADLKSMPHLLIAGSTGAGKSVCINSIIISLLYKAKPDEVKLVLIDPKVVELVGYNGIPHLLVPVVTEAGKASAALNWAVAEMTDRYKKFAKAGVRDLASYNKYIADKISETGDGGAEETEGESFGETMSGFEAETEILPQIVIIIDELADLMMASPSQVEESICRLAQMARAAGMHLIVATQRPSVDVITGLIKANIPSRIAFAVSSQFDSRTILDMGGAEKLVGKGDMLFSPLGFAKPVRVQGSFVSDSEVNGVIEFVKKQIQEPCYSEDVMHSIEKRRTGLNEEESDDDEFLQEAIETVVLAKQASTSMLQRRFRIGYNRAARLMDIMESRGIIGPADGSRSRSVLMTEDELKDFSGDDETEKSGK